MLLVTVETHYMDCVPLLVYILEVVTDLLKPLKRDPIQNVVEPDGPEQREHNNLT